MPDEIVHDPNLPVCYVNGIPIPTGRRQVTGKDVIEQLKNALSTDYTGKDPKKYGLTKNEAMLLSIVEQAQEGNLAAADFVLDRFVGKPTQNINALSVTASLQEFLDGIDRTDPGSTADIDPLGD